MIETNTKFSNKPSGIARVHIGHHFFGSGNCGDDWMLAGFLVGLRSQSRRINLSCCTPFDIESQRHRFPEIAWLPYDESTRQKAIATSDAWLGLGGSPFQTIASDWFLQHLLKEREFCQRSATPQFFLGVGVNDLEALDHPATRPVCESSVRIWTRDLESQKALASLGYGAKTEHAGDLAHLYLEKQAFCPPPSLAPAGMVMNFEEYDIGIQNKIYALIKNLGNPAQVRWIAQETRSLPGSELDTYASMPGEFRKQLSLVPTAYSNSSLEDFLTPFRSVSQVVTSRYHAALVGAWSGCRVTVIERNFKLSALTKQLPFVAVRLEADEAQMEAAVSKARPMERSALHAMAVKTQRAVDEWVECL